MSKGIDELKDWAMHNVRLINILPSNKNLPVDVRLIDVLEDEVDEKYYLSEEKTSQLTLNIREDSSDSPYKIGGLYGASQAGSIWDRRNISPTLKTSSGGYSEPLIQEMTGVVEGLPIREATKQGYAVACEGDAVNFQYPTSKTRRGRVGKDGQAQTLEASGINQGVVINPPKEKTENIRQPKADDEPRLVGGIGEKNFGKQFRQGNRVYDADAAAMC